MTFQDGLSRVVGALEGVYYGIGDAMMAAVQGFISVGVFVRGLLLFGLCAAVLTGLGWLAYLAWGHPERIGVAIGVIAVPLILRFLFAGFTGDRRSHPKADNSVLESRSNPASINFSGKR